MAKSESDKAAAKYAAKQNKAEFPKPKKEKAPAKGKKGK